MLNALGNEQPSESHLTNATSAEDAAFVDAVLRKDRKATAEFVSRYADRIYAYIRSISSPIRSG